MRQYKRKVEKNGLRWDGMEKMAKKQDAKRRNEARQVERRDETRTALNPTPSKINLSS